MKLFIAEGLAGVRGFAGRPAVCIWQGLAESVTLVVDATGSTEEVHFEEPLAVVAAEVGFRIPVPARRDCRSGCATQAV